MPIHNLGSIPLIHVDVDDQSWLSWSAYLRTTGQTDVKRRGIRFTNYVQATQAALDGQGIMLGWRSITGDLVREGWLVETIAAPMVPNDAFYTVNGETPRSAPACQAVADWLLQEAERT